MSEKPSPPRTIRGYTADSISTANFQALRAAASARAASSAQSEDEWVARKDSMSSANFQGLAAKEKPVASASVKPPAATASAPAKSTARPQEQ